MAKVQKSLRVNEDIAAAVSLLAKDGETEAATYNRVLAAGVDALNQADEGEQTQDGVNLTPELFESMKAHIETLKASNKKLGEQLEVKDGQIRALSVLTAQAQELHGASVTKAIDQPARDTETMDDNQGEGKDGEQRRSWWARIFG